jgi:hypothetical protein
MIGIIVHKMKNLCTSVARITTFIPNDKEIQHGCGEEVTGYSIASTIASHHFSPHHPQIIQIWVNLTSSVAV